VHVLVVWLELDELSDGNLIIFLVFFDAGGGKFE
jgi:hypothetical protein